MHLLNLTVSKALEEASVSVAQLINAPVLERRGWEFDPHPGHCYEIMPFFCYKSLNITDPSLLLN